MKTIASLLFILIVSTSAFAAVSVSSPVKNETVASPFTLSATASACSSQPIASMGYSLDNSANTTVVDKASISAQVSASSGTHTVHVKSWGDKGASCVTDVAITVSASAAPPATANVATSGAGITVDTPSTGQTVSSPFTLSADASSCSSQTVASMGYSLDNSSDTTVVDKTSIDAQVSASAGTHTLHVKSWGDKGSACSAAVSINVGTVTDDASADSSVVPSDATSVSAISSLSTWKAQHDTGTPGSSSGSMTMVDSPVHTGPAREFKTSFSGSGGERYSVSFSDDTSSTNLFYDTWIYVASPSTAIGNIEMDLNQVMANGQTALFGFQCDGYNGTWDYTENAGTPAKPVDKWVHSGAKCNPRSWSTNTWHHVQVQYSRTSAGAVTYKAVWLDGVESAINATVNSAFALGWAPSIITNLQIDGIGSGSATVYLDDTTVYRW